MLSSKIKSGLILALSVSTPGWAGSAFEQNPITTGLGITVSHQGIYHYNATADSLSWQRQIGDHTFAPTIANDTLLVSSSRGVNAYHHTTGEPMWSFPSDGAYSATIVSNQAYIAHQNGQLIALNIEDGSPIWNRQLPGWIYPPAALSDLLVTGGSEGTVWAIERKSGSVIWTKQLGQELVYRPVALNPDQVAITSFDSKITIVDRNGSSVWTRQLPSLPVYPVSAFNHLYVHELGGNLHAFSLKDGQHLWQHTLDEKPAAGVWASNNRIHTVSTEGTIQILNSRSGELLKTVRIDQEPITPITQFNNRTLVIADASGTPKPIFLDLDVHSDPPKESNHE